MKSVHPPLIGVALQVAYRNKPSRLPYDAHEESLIDDREYQAKKRKAQK